jgi:hypothetical protein
MKKLFSVKLFMFCWLSIVTLLLLLLVFRKFFDIDLFPYIGRVIFFTAFIAIVTGGIAFVRSITLYSKQKK